MESRRVGVRPHELLRQELNKNQEKKTSSAVEREVKDVLETAHGTDEGGESARFAQTRLRAAFARRDKVEIDGGALSIGADRIDLDPKIAGELEVLGPNRAVIADLHRGLAAPRPILFSAAEGSGTAFTARWYLEATHTPYQFVSLTSATTLDSLAGVRRPEKGGFRIEEGPLTKCVRDGGVLVVDGLDSADDEVLAALKALAKGAEYFHHPVSGEPIKVNDNFKLVLIHNAARDAPQDLLRVSSVSEIRAYDATEQETLLTSKYRVPAQLAKKLVSFATKLTKEAKNAEKIDFGHRFSLSWSLLDRVGRRLLKKGTSERAVEDALTGIYGMRLSAGPMRDAFREMLAKDGLGTEDTPSRRKRELKTQGFIDLGGEFREALEHSLLTLEAGETLLLCGPGQTGVTRLVDEIGAQRRQEIVTIPGHAFGDLSMLMETPRFDKDGQVYLEMGRLAQALLAGHLVFVDNVDHMSPERQNAFFQLQKLRSIPILEDGKIVHKPIPKRAAIVLAATEGIHSSRSPPDAADRASITEVRLPVPELEHLMTLVQDKLQGKPEVAALIKETVRALHQELPDLGLTKMQRFIDFVRASLLLTEALTPERAVKRAIELVFHPPATSAAMHALEKKAAATKEPTAKVWQKLLRLKPSTVAERLKSTPYEITPATEAHLEVMAIAYRLKRPVILHGPAGSGKTVLGALFAKITGKGYERVNLSDATEPRDLFGGAGVSNIDDKVVIADVPGPARRAAHSGKTVLAIDEYNLNPNIHMLMKSMADYRRKLIDAENNVDIPFGDGLLLLSGNFVDQRTGRVEAPPVFTDSTFELTVDLPPPDERIDRLTKQTKIERPLVSKVVHAFQDLETLVRKYPAYFEKKSGPLTFTERDMLKALGAAEHLIARDKIKDEETKQRILSREVYRVFADMIESPQGREKLLDTLRLEKHFGPIVEPPVRPTKVERVKIDGVEYLQIGVARLPMRHPGTGDIEKELQKLIPKARGVSDPIGPQLAFLESLMLSLELNQPVAVVGATGTGKTMLVRWLGHQIGMPLHEQACHGDMTPEDMVGTTVLDEKKKGVRYEYAPTSASAKYGGWAVLDEFLTAGNSTRETQNCATEKTELQILNKRPTERIPWNEWHPESRLIVLTNGGDIRKDDFSEAEASRFRIIGIPDFESVGDYKELALRDYTAPQDDVSNYEVPKRTLEAKNAAYDRLSAMVDGRTRFGRQVLAAIAYARGQGSQPELEEQPAPPLDMKEASFFADLLHLVDNVKAEPLLGIVDSWIAAQEPAFAMAVRARAPDGCGPNTMSRADAGAVSKDRLTNPDEAIRAAEMFVKLRDLSRKARSTGLSPLTPRIFTSFVDLYVELRKKGTAGEAAERAAQLSLWSKLPETVQPKALELLTESFGSGAKERPAEAPRPAEDGLWFGNTLVKYGREKPWQADPARFPLTPERCKNLALFADGVVLGRGRPIACTDDANGESVEEVREFGHRTGWPVTVITLAPDIDLEAMIEKQMRSEDPEAIAGFAPILQQIGQAVRDGHILVIRGANNVSSTILERLNSLGDGRLGLKLPRSKRFLEAHPNFRLVLMKQPGAKNPFSPALENRLLEPLMSTRDGGNADLGARAAELAQIVYRRVGVAHGNDGFSEDTAMRLAIFHTYVNDVVREKGFAGSLNVGSFLNRDAEAVARRLVALKRAQSVEDEMEMLAYLVQQQYGRRFDAPEDRALIAEFARTIFNGADASQVKLAGDLNPNPKLLRLGAWAVQRDTRKERAGIPGESEMLPFTPSLLELQQQIFPAFQFDEVLYLHGNETLAMGAVKSVARFTSSPVFEVEANEKLSEAYLFGGMLQDPKTGEWGEYEGVLWQAQREGGTLIIKDASRLPPQILTQLAEISATGHVTRMKGESMETRPRAFRLVLHSEEAYLPVELASVATRVDVPDITDPAELEAILGHTLHGVPGGSQFAKVLRAFAADADQLAAQAAIERTDDTPRQELKFGTTHLFAAARELGHAWRKGVEIETALADVITRLYLSPARGLPLEAALRDRIEMLSVDLDKVLVAEIPNTIDYVERPQLAALDRDYRHASPALTQSVLQAALETAKHALDKGDVESFARLAVGLGSTDLVPQAISTRAQKLVKRWRDGEFESQEVLEKEIKALIGTLDRAVIQGEPPDFHATLLEFLRGGRLWDLDHRLAILDRYEALLDTIGEHGNLIDELRQARQRFQTAGALDRVEKMRAQVSHALEAYQNRRGESDEQLASLFRLLIEKWDLVSTSPIFRDHHLLRTELAELQILLEEIRDAHSERAQENAEVANLLEALSAAGETLTSLRIAEQSAELRRELDRTATNAAQLFDSMKVEVLEVERLEEAKKEHGRLAEIASRVSAASREELFLTLTVDADVARPEQRDREELRPRAREEARVITQGLVATERTKKALEMQAAMEAMPTPDVAHMFDGYDPIAGGLMPSLQVDVEKPKDAIHDQFAKLEQEIAAFETKSLAEHEERLIEKLSQEEKSRAADKYVDRVRARANEIAARVHKTVADLSYTLESMARDLDLKNEAPELFAEVEATREVIAETAKTARNWAERWLESARELGFEILDLLTFNFFKFGKKKKEKELLDLAPAQAKAAECIGKIDAYLKKKLEALPDFEKIPEHEQKTKDLEAELLSATTLGELSARFAKLSEYTKKEPTERFRRHLEELMNRLARTEYKKMLPLVQSFSDAADMLSSQAGREGIAIELEPVVDLIVRAAETTRNQALADRSYRASLRALRLAVQRIESLGDLEKLPPVLVDLHERMVGILALLTAGTESPLETRKEEASEEMIKLLGERHRDPAEELLEEVQQRSVEAIEETPIPFTIDRVLERAMEVTGERIGAEAFDVRVRSDELRIVEIELGRFEGMNVPEPKPVEATDAKLNDPEPISEEVEAVRQRARNAAGELDALVKDAVGGLSEQRETLVRVLSELERGLRGTTLGTWRSELSVIAEGLADIAESPKSAREMQMLVNRATSSIQAVVRGLQAIETIPEDIAFALSTVADGVHALGGAFGTDRFAGLAISWSANALMVVRDCEAQLGELSSKLDEAAAPQADPPQALRLLSKLADELGSKLERLGAYSRFSMLAHLHQRLSAERGAFASDVDRQAADELLARVKEHADRLLSISGGQTGEQAIADLHGAYMDLGAVFAETKVKTIPIDAFENLGGLIGGLLGAESEDAKHSALDRMKLMRSVLESMTKNTKGAAHRAVRELLRTSNEVQSSLLVQAFEELERRFGKNTSDYVANLRTTVVDLAEVSRRFVAYDPLTEKRLMGELAGELAGALENAKKSLVGPGAVWIAQAILAFWENLEALAEANDQLGRLAKGIVAQHGDLAAECRDLNKHEHAAERMTDMITSVTAQIKKTRADRVKRKDLEWLREVVPALESLIASTPEAMPALLESVEKEHFPELHEKWKRISAPKPPPPPETRPTPERRPKPATPKAEALEPELKPQSIEIPPTPSGSGSGSFTGSGFGSSPQVTIVSPRDAAATGSLTRKSLKSGGLSLALDRAHTDQKQGKQIDMMSLGLDLPPVVDKRGQKSEQPEATDEPIKQGDTKGRAGYRGNKDYDRKSNLGNVERTPLKKRGLPEESRPLQELKIEKADLGGITKALNKIREAAKMELEGGGEEEPLNGYQDFKEQNRDRISKLVKILRALGDTELLVLVDQSTSTLDEFNGTTIIAQEQAGVGLLLGAVQQSESNCSVLGFGSPSIGAEDVEAIAERDGVHVFPHKSTLQPLDDEFGNAVFDLCGVASGGTDIDLGLEVARKPELFSANANNKMIVVFTDAQDPDPEATRQKIEDLRADGYGVIVIGLGDADHVKDVAGEWGIHVNSMEDMLEKLPALLERALVHHAGRKLGQASGSAQGIGVSEGNHPLQSAEGASLDLVDDLHTPMQDPGEGGELIVPTGPKRDQRNLVDRTKYEAALRGVKQRRTERRATAELKRARLEIASLEALQRRNGLGTTLREAFAHGMPRARGMEWEKKQLSGPYFDPDRLPYYFIGLAQGVPELRLFMRRKPVGKSASRMVVVNDISTSTARPELRRRLIEASVAVTNAYKSGVPNGEVAHLSMSDRVRLHQGFDMDWNDEAKAHLMMELNEAHPATDDERAGMEAVGMLDMLGTDVGLVVVLTDGQGMPGTPEIVRQAAERGYGVLVVGVGPECRSVARFGEHALYARNVTHLGHIFWDGLNRAWEQAGRTVK